MEYGGVSWCIFGDFNEVSLERERENATVNVKGMEEFNDFIARNNLEEAPMVGNQFTRISDDGLKRNRSDRFMMTVDFWSRWRNLGVKSLERKWPDHFPIVLIEDRKDFGPKPFKFFDTWLSEIELVDIVNNEWKKEVSSKNPDGVFRDKLQNVKTAIKNWACKKFRNFVATNCARMEFLELEDDTLKRGWVDTKREEWVQKRKRWLDLEKRNVDMDKQKPKLKWIFDVDENSKIFHIEDLLKAITWFWEKGEISLGCNSAFVTLSPKSDSPLHLGDFRPFLTCVGNLLPS
ncbi:hypothetical protein OSB04_008054 [Centaurea solstitialis]|uniref:Uncharacterized protein n=1 Tax=Centaurea solstitialis TaxID=347529 RepID=A0AA38WSX8_9ASTR|nr:hypothetical protein OSB04_008054 [Centaurea solstitialis]